MQKLLLIIIVNLLISSCSHYDKFYSGYIDADLTYLSGDFSGRLISLLIHRGDLVKKNQLLFQLEQLNETRNIHTSWQTQSDLIANRNQIISKLIYAKNDYHRKYELNLHEAGSTDAKEQAKQNLDVLKYQLKSIDAQIKKNEIITKQNIWQKDRKENIALESGIIYDTFFTEGEFVQGGQPVLAMITPKNIKVVFYVPEVELGKIQKNQTFKIITDGNNTPYDAKITYIANKAEYTPPIIYSKEERQKLVFKVEMRIINANLNQIHLGQPVSIELK